ncbi:hypothetical protein A9Q90_10370 [Gammaproteobacteria bacterium 54_18_T64]|nr:hypothetical protein A9Q90_10370 [Gammaproteobacteria bacterium 54_18_T64]
MTGIAAIITATTGLYMAINTRSLATEEAITSAGPAINTAIETSLKASGSASPLGPEGIAKLEALAQQSYEQLPQTNLKPLVDCRLFPTVNSTASLMSWSNYYHEKVLYERGDTSHACNKTIDYRGMAHCKEPNNMTVRQALYETLSRCRTAGIEWTDIKHSSL